MDFIPRLVTYCKPDLGRRNGGGSCANVKTDFGGIVASVGGPSVWSRVYAVEAPTFFRVQDDAS